MGVVVLETSEGEPERAFSADVASEESLARFESDFGLYVSEKLPGLVAVHAALLHVDDAVLIVPGYSGAGKSSLCVAAMEAGWEVWSDEYCLIDTVTGQVSGWPRPIRQRLPGGGVRRIDHQGLRGPGLATHVIAMTYLEQEEGVSLEAVSPGQVAMDLMANTVCARSRPEETFRATTALAKTVTGFAGVRGEITRALPLIRDRLKTLS
jgi:serine kinase of HPr protein (carbohydrate metabolism regulator)